MEPTTHFQRIVSPSFGVDRSISQSKGSGFLELFEGLVLNSGGEVEILNEAVLDKAASKEIVTNDRETTGESPTDGSDEMPASFAEPTETETIDVVVPRQVETDFVAPASENDSLPHPHELARPIGGEIRFTNEGGVWFGNRDSKQVEARVDSVDEVPNRQQERAYQTVQKPMAPAQSPHIFAQNADPASGQMRPLLHPWAKVEQALVSEESNLAAATSNSIPAKDPLATLNLTEKPRRATLTSVHPNGADHEAKPNPVLKLGERVETPKIHVDSPLQKSAPSPSDSVLSHSRNERNEPVLTPSSNGVLRTLVESSAIVPSVPGVQSTQVPNDLQNPKREGVVEVPAMIGGAQIQQAVAKGTPDQLRLRTQLFASNPQVVQPIAQSDSNVSGRMLSSMTEVSKIPSPAAETDQPSSVSLKPYEIVGGPSLPETPRSMISNGSMELARSVSSQLRSQISNVSSEGFDIALRPVELGNVRLALLANEVGSTLVIHAERAETLELLRRHIGILEQDLKAMGHENLSLRFSNGSFSGQTPQGHQHGASINSRDERHLQNTSEQAGNAPLPSSDHNLARENPSDSLDLRL